MSIFFLIKKNIDFTLINSMFLLYFFLTFDYDIIIMWKNVTLRFTTQASLANINIAQYENEKSNFLNIKEKTTLSHTSNHFPHFFKDSFILDRHSFKRCSIVTFLKRVYKNESFYFKLEVWIQVMKKNIHTCRW